jgi:hypothetical protein
MAPDWQDLVLSMKTTLVRLVTISLLLGAGVLLQACLVATVAGAAADVGVAAVKTTVAVGKAIIP